MWLSKKKRAARVEIAQDALRRLEADEFKVAASSGYVSLYWDASIARPAELRDLVPLSKKCRVCLLGACFLSFAHIHDQVPSADLELFNMDWEEATCGRLGSKYVYDCLSEYFDTNTLVRMECAFELAPLPVRARTLFGLRPGVEDALKFGHRYVNSSRERAIAVLKYVIAHNGEFNPAATEVRQEELVTC